MLRVSGMFLVPSPLTSSYLGRLPGTQCTGVTLYRSDCVAHLKCVFSSTFFPANIFLHFVEAYPLRVKKKKKCMGENGVWEYSCMKMSLCKQYFDINSRLDKSFYFRILTVLFCFHFSALQFIQSYLNCFFVSSS